MPLSMILVVFSIPAVETYGPRRVLVTTWLIRNIAASDGLCDSFGHGIFRGNSCLAYSVFFNLLFLFGKGYRCGGLASMAI